MSSDTLTAVADRVGMATDVDSSGELFITEVCNQGEKGDNISFKDVLAISESTQNTIGSPLVEGAVVEAKILDQIRDKKIIVFKKRKRQNYRSTQGHRQYLTVLKIETISMGGKKSQSEKKEAKTKTPVKKAAPKKAAPKKAAPKETAVKKTAKKKTTTPKEDK